jgi:phosphatidylglycerophosphate synthase
MVQALLLVVLARTVGLSGGAAMVGVTCALVVTWALATGQARSGRVALGPADRVTLLRATLVVGVAALAAEALQRAGGGGHAVVVLLVALAAGALVLDAVDGWLARRTGTSSELGARFDMEVDALLILVLSVYVAGAQGLWVLAIGTARYAFLVAGRVLPWLRGTTPPRYWCKVVASVQGVLLTVAAAAVLPAPLTGLLLFVALVLLAESFARQIWWLWLARNSSGLQPVPATHRALPVPVLAERS